MAFEECVRLACNLVVWPAVKSCLEEVSTIKCEHKLVARLNKIYSIVHGRNSEQASRRGDVDYRCTVFNGLAHFLGTVASPSERKEFFSLVLPLIVQSAVNIEKEGPAAALYFNCQQQSGSTRLTRTAILSIVACSFLCLFPGRRCSKHSLLSAINFDDFFVHLSSPSQCAKLRCFLEYFKRNTDCWFCPSGCVTFTRKVMPKCDMPLLDNWLSCDQPLCDINVRVTGRIGQDASDVVQVALTNRKIGGAVLSAGCEQEELQFCTRPELLAAVLFMQALDENEAVMAHGFETFSSISRTEAGVHFVSPYRDPALLDKNGDLDTTLCVMDVLGIRHIGGATRQYADAPLLRELNKAFIGFRQSEQREDACRDDDELGPLSSDEEEDEEFFSAIDTLGDDEESGYEKVQPSLTSLIRPLTEDDHGEGGEGGRTAIHKYIGDLVHDAFSAAMMQEDPAAGDRRASAIIDQIIADALATRSRHNRRRSADGIRGESLSDEVKALIMGLGGPEEHWLDVSAVAQQVVSECVCHAYWTFATPLYAYADRLLQAAFSDAFAALLRWKHGAAAIETFADHAAQQIVSSALRSRRLRCAHRSCSLGRIPVVPSRSTARRRSLDSVIRSTTAATAPFQMFLFPLQPSTPAAPRKDCRRNRQRDRPLFHSVDSFVTALVVDAFNDAHDELYAAAISRLSAAPLVEPPHGVDVVATVMARRVLRDAVQIAGLYCSSSKTDMQPMPVATGDCGYQSYGGDPQLRAIVQWLAASRASVPSVTYYTYQNECLSEMSSICGELTSEELTVGQLLSRVVSYCRGPRTGQSLFQSLAHSDH